MAKRFLIVVDMQNDFISGALGTAEARAAVEPAAARIAAAREAGEALVATLDTHTPDYLDTAEGRHLPVAHCIAGSEGWQLNGRIAAALGDAPRVEKPTFGSLLLPRLVAELAGGEPEAVELIGLCTDICVVSNALILKAHFPEAEISVRADCCAGVTPQSHRAALDTLRSCQVTVL